MKAATISSAPSEPGRGTGRSFGQRIAGRVLKVGHLAVLATALGISSIAPQNISAFADEAARSRRLALVVGQADYRDARLITGMSDASTMLEALESAGFDVEGGADLEQHLLREKVASLVDRAGRAGDVETILVYVNGRVAQIDGENLLLPVGAPLDRAADVVLNSVRLDDLVKALKTVPAKARIIVVDAAPAPESVTGHKAFSPGLALIEPPSGFLVVFNQSPGRPLVEPQPPMGVFVTAFIDAVNQPVAFYRDTFALARQRAFDESRNRVVPWTADRLGDVALAFFAPPLGTQVVSVAPPGETQTISGSETREEAFKRVIASDSIVDYQAFLVRFPRDEAVPVIQYNLAVRREAEVWSRAQRINTPHGYWTYLAAYPDGGNASVARHRLAGLGAALDVPAGFVPMAFTDLPPPLPQAEVIAASASMPIEHMPPPPPLGLQPIAPTVAALTAVPVAGAVAHRLPARAGVPIQPSWWRGSGSAGGFRSGPMPSPVVGRAGPVRPPYQGGPLAPRFDPLPRGQDSGAVGGRAAFAPIRPAPLARTPVSATSPNPREPIGPRFGHPPVRSHAGPVGARPGFSHGRAAPPPQARGPGRVMPAHHGGAAMTQMPKAGSPRMRSGPGAMPRRAGPPVRATQAPQRRAPGR